MYITIFNIQGQHWLSVNDDGSIEGSETIQGAIEAWRGFKEWLHSSDFTQANSATIALIQLQPVVIDGPNNPKEIVDYVAEVDRKPQRISSMAFHAANGVKISSKILEGRETIDVFKELMKPDTSPGDKERESFTP